MTEQNIYVEIRVHVESTLAPQQTVGSTAALLYVIVACTRSIGVRNIRESIWGPSLHKGPPWLRNLMLCESAFKIKMRGNFASVIALTLFFSACAAAAATPTDIPGFVRTEGLAKSSVFYNGEHQKLYKQEPKRVRGTRMMPIYGLLPEGTEGGVNENEVTGVVIGDSFASPLAGVFNDIATDRGIKFTMTSIPSCAAFFDKVSMNHKIEDWPKGLTGNKQVVDCKQYRRKEMLALAKKSKAKVVFFAANWLASRQLWTAVNSGGADDPVSETMHALKKTGKKIVIFGVFPGAHFNVRECMAGETNIAPDQCPRESRILPPYDGEESEQKKMGSRLKARQELSRIMAKPDIAELGFEFIDPTQSMCPSAGSCLVSLHGEPLYNDAMHLTANGGRLLRQEIDQVLDKFLR